MIVIIDYKMGNVGSILNMLKKIGEEAVISSDLEEIKKANKLILPGLGSFDAGIKNLTDLGLIPALNQKVLNEKTPILGICLGMQLFSQKSEEGISKGLGWIDGVVKKFQFENKELKIPHMGWNTIEFTKNDVLFSDMLEKSRFYFVHSYHVVCQEKEIIATTNYGYDFPSVIRQDNIIGVQFHPEKSHKFGKKLLENFAKLC